MATTLSTQIPISTKALNFFRDVGAFLVLCLVGNPVSMFCLNMAFPGLAAKFAHNLTFCNEKMCKFYTKLALKWPYYWAMWWIDRKNLSKYSAEEQIDYFFDVDNSEKTLFALSPDAVVALMYDHSSIFQNVAMKYNLRDEMIDEVIRRAADNQPIWKNVFEKQLQKGTLPKKQAAALLRAAIDENRCGVSNYFRYHLCHYVKRCGLSDTLQHHLETSRASDDFKCKVLECLSHYKQKCAVRSHADTDNISVEEEWKLYCQENELCYEVQKEMTVAQYVIFHFAGCLLSEDAIVHFFKTGRDDMIKHIEEFEPKSNIIKAKMKLLELT